MIAHRVAAGAVLSMSLCLGAEAEAQLQSLGSVTVDHAPTAEAPDQTTPSGEPIQIAATTLDVRTTVPIPLAHNGPLLITGLNYRVISFDSAADFDNLHRLTIPIRTLNPLSKTWSLLVGIEPALTTSFNDVATRNIQLGGVGLFRYQWFDNFSVGFGVLANRNFGRLVALPAGLLNWRPNDVWTVDLFLPAFANVRAEWNRFAVDLSVAPEGDVYPVEGQADGQVDSIRFSQIQVDVGANLRLVSQLWLRAFAGMLTRRQLEVVDRGDNTLADFGLDPGPIFGGSLVFRIPADRAKEKTAQP